VLRLYLSSIDYSGVVQSYAVAADDGANLKSAIKRFINQCLSLKDLIGTLFNTIVWIIPAKIVSNVFRG